MKIWQLDPANLTTYYNIALCDALAKAGHDVRYVTSTFLYDLKLIYPDTFHLDIHYFRALENPLLLRFPRIRKGLRAISYFWGHWRLLRKIKAHRPDIIHFQWSRVPVFDQWLIRQIRKLGIPIVHTIHDVQPLFSQGSLTGQLADVYSLVDAFVLHTEQSKQEFVKTYELEAKHIVLIPHLSLDDPYLPDSVTRSEAREKLGLSSESYIILCFGLVKHYKGIDVLVEAFEGVKTHREDAQLLVAGHPETSKDRQLLDEIGEQKRVYVRPEFVPSDMVWQYHVAADVIIFPYRHIFQSGALIKALQYGRPVIVTDVGGLPESVDGNGWVVPPEDPEALANAILEALSDPARLDAMGDRSKSLVQLRYAPSAVAHSHLELYQALSELGN